MSSKSNHDLFKDIDATIMVLDLLSLRIEDPNLKELAESALIKLKKWKTEFKSNDTFKPTYHRPNKTIILIDDDPLIISLWNHHFLEMDVNFLHFDNWDKFIENSSDLSGKEIVYMDFELDNKSPSIESRTDQLLDLGIKEIHITTGHPKFDVCIPKKIKSVIGKIPPSVL